MFIKAEPQNDKAQAKLVLTEYSSEAVRNFVENPYRRVGRIDLLDKI